TVIKSASFHQTGTKDDLKSYLEKNAQKIKEQNEFRYAGLGFDIRNKHLSFFDNPDDRHPIASFFCTRLATENRIVASNPAGALALHQQPASHPIHLLLMDDILADRISAHF